MNRFDSHRDKPASTGGSQVGDPTTVPAHRVRPEVISCGSLTVALGRTPRVMGVLNVTPDSFSDGGQFFDVGNAVEHALSMRTAGAHIIDIGGESTRPGAQPVSAGEELDRVLPVIDALTQMTEFTEARLPISIDTRKAEVADVALRRGCHMVNDISAASDTEMVGVLREYPRVPIVLMHMKGDPTTMQESPHYEDVVREVSDYLSTRAEELVRSGIESERIIIDPGIGFGKRFRDNLELLNRVDSFLGLGYPLLIGASRKRFLGELLDADGDDRLPGNLAVAAHCYRSGVDIIRVHDVAETTGLLKVLDAMAHPEHCEADW
jgi:dihydropteroate synthase